MSTSDVPGDSRAAAGGPHFLGRYRVVEEIGMGGMASVHLARMDGPGGFQKWVAIKRIHPHLVEDQTFVNMFVDEARVVARISHPNVATVFELGKHEDTYWIAMEYLHGEPLREVMRRTEELGRPTPPEIACRVIADAAEGLHAAHELRGDNGEKLGLVHRDVTPHNLFVNYDGSTKVVDFGIAKFHSRIAKTRAGMLKGKLAYMSPEQVAGAAVDRRSDVFALGVVLWELTTGQRLFRMESDIDTLAKVQDCVVPHPSGVMRGYPGDLEAIVMKALARSSRGRYGTAREFSRALQSLLMRRGLFVGADEVSAYMNSIFGDRVRKREAHLRLAAEAAHSLELGATMELVPPSWRPDDGSAVSFNSEVQRLQPQSPRPANRADPPAREARPFPVAVALPQQEVPAADDTLDDSTVVSDPVSMDFDGDTYPTRPAAAPNRCDSDSNPVHGSLSSASTLVASRFRNTLVDLPAEAESSEDRTTASRQATRVIPRPASDLAPASIFGRAKVREARPLQGAIRDGRRAAVTIRRRRQTYRTPVWLAATLLGLGAFVVVALLIFALTHKRASSKTRGSTTINAAPAYPSPCPKTPAPMLDRCSKRRAFSGMPHPATSPRRQG
jgi:serine/threonine-protein kinase